MSIFDVSHLNPQLLKAAPKLSKKHFAERLARFAKELAPQSVAIIVSNAEATRSNDTEFAFRQSSDLYYLNGFPEPDTALVITKLGKGKPKVIMFVRPKDRLKEIWTGPRAGVEGAKSKYLANEAYDIARFEEVMSKLIPQAKQVYYRHGINKHLDERFTKIWELLQKPLINPGDILHEMRLFKSKEEAELLAYAAEVSALAHCEAMKACRPGMYEYQLQAILEYIFRYYGATGPAYGSIVASGNNAITLHWTNNDSQIKDGDMVLIDAACEFGGLNGGYAADITRTFPANGRFTDAQADIYQLVLDAQEAAIAACRPGIAIGQVHLVSKNVLRRGLIKLGILPKNYSIKSETPPKHPPMTCQCPQCKSHSLLRKKDLNKPVTLLDFFMHGTSHWLGIDVHDVGNYNRAGEPYQPDRRKPKRRILETGMVFTVEPGLYFEANDTRVPKRYRGIGVRIEDDVVITKKGCWVLTDSVPKSIADIEALMQQG